MTDASADAAASRDPSRPETGAPARRPPLRGGTTDARPPPPPPAASPAGLVFGHLDDEFRLAVVKDALRARSTNPGAACDRLNGRLRSTLQLPGFRNAAKAPSGQLAIPVLEKIRHGDDLLAAAVLNLWTHANAPLRAAAADTLRAAGLPTGAEPLAAHFGGTWSFDEWLDLRDAFAAAHPDADPEAAGLMLAVAGDRLPLPPPQPDIRSPRFLAWMDELDALPDDAPEWTDAEDFAFSVFMLAAEREAERRAAARDARDAAIRGTADEYADELRYLGIDLEPWLADGAPDPRLAARLVDELAAVLSRYRPVRPQGATRAEESERAGERAELETATLAFPARWQALPRDAAEPDEDGGAAPADDPPPAAVPPEMLEAHRELRAERDRLRTDNANLAAERERLDLANASLRLARRQVDEDNDRLRGELDRAQATEEQWRLAYVEARRAGASDADADEHAISGVADALSLAERAFPDALAVSLNPKSDPEAPFAKPAEVFDALAWLATAYRRRTAAIAESCPGWFHKTDQSAATVGMYPDWYRTTYRGRTLSIHQHVGKGASFDARSTIRIAFAWDDETDRVVVGYVGRHQRDRHS